MKENELLNKIRNTYCRVKPSKHGVGLFAVRSIMEGVIVTCLTKEQSQSLKIKESKVYDACRNDEIKMMVHDYFEHLKGYVLVDAGGLDGISLLSFINHSENPNCKFIKLNGMIALKTTEIILYGKELLVNYRKRRYVHFNFLKGE